MEESVASVTVRDLRNHGGEVLDRVQRGEMIVVTRDGAAVAELRPRPRRPLPISELVDRRRALPPVNPAELRRDIDAATDPRL